MRRIPVRGQAIKLADGTWHVSVIEPDLGDTVTGIVRERRNAARTVRELVSRVFDVSSMKVHVTEVVYK